ncbi:MAG: hypothetical protein ACTSQY_11765 [Candidatus Odinarchaeia archaeon]
MRELQKEEIDYYIENTLSMIEITQKRIETNKIILKRVTRYNTKLAEIKQKLLELEDILKDIKERIDEAK